MRFLVKYEGVIADTLFAEGEIITRSKRGKNET